MTLTPEQKAEGWIEWDRGKRPIQDARTIAMVRTLYDCIVDNGWDQDEFWHDEVLAYRIIEAHGADVEPARPTPFPASYDELVWDADGVSQPFMTGGTWPGWLPDDALWQAQSVGELWASKGWFTGELAIRVRRREPKRETVQCSIMFDSISPVAATIDLIDGKPDLSTLKIAENAL